MVGLMDYLFRLLVERLSRHFAIRNVSNSDPGFATTLICVWQSRQYADLATLRKEQFHEE